MTRKGSHHVHFESYAASMAGQFARARRTASKLTSNVTPYIAGQLFAVAIALRSMEEPRRAGEEGGCGTRARRVSARLDHRGRQAADRGLVIDRTGPHV
jgi:hypothetical protein